MWFLHLLFLEKTWATLNVSQYQALYEFYNATGGDYWVEPRYKVIECAANSSNCEQKWNFNNYMDDPCNTKVPWWGLTCATVVDSQLQVVVSIDLGHYNLSGILPDAIFENLVSMISLNLSFNNLYSTLPSSLALLSGLRVLGLHHIVYDPFLYSPHRSNFDDESDIDNDFFQLVVEDLDRTQRFRFNGTLPPLLLNLTSIVELNLAGNDFVGEIPDGLGGTNNPYLSILDINFNQITGTLPSSLTEHTPNLVSLNLFRNKLTGTIPPFVAAVNLSLLILGDNNLHGTFPILLTDRSSLEVLSLGTNEFSGTLPADIGKLRKLKLLNLEFNRFTSVLPSEIGYFKSIESLIINNNHLNGTLPSSIYSLTNLTYLIVSNNSFTGTLPDDLSRLVNLNVLQFSENRINSTIPSNLSSLSRVREIYLDDNQLTGTFPSTFMECKTLVVLNIGFNSLKGPIPDGWSSGKLRFLYFGNNQLTGEIPHSFKYLTNLTELFCPYNQLNGTIPDIFGSLNRFEVHTFISSS